MLTSGDEGRVCKDIPESACHEESGNFLKHITSLSASKISDGLIDPKLVLSWLLTTLGAPAFIIGLLVPVREAGALLPQLFTAAALRSCPSANGPGPSALPCRGCRLPAWPLRP